MNWFEAFWKKLTAPPGAEPAMSAGSTEPTAAGGPQKNNPPNTPMTWIRNTWKFDPTEAQGSATNFTPRAQQILALARKEADRFNHNFVGTEHVLLGLLKLGQGVAVNVLMKQGLDLQNVRAEVEKQVGVGPEHKMVGNIPYTPRVKKVLALGIKEAAALKHTYVGTEHILLGLLSEGQGVAARVLFNLGVDIEDTRQEILKELDPNFAGAADRPETPRPIPAAPQADRSRLPRDRYTPRVRRTFTLAVEEAEQRNQPFVETEHVLLGLVRMGQGVAAFVLIKIGVNAETVAAHFHGALPSQPAPGAEQPRFGALVQEMLALAEEESAALEHTYVGTEHILLALLRQPLSGAARILKELYVDPDALRKQVMLAFEVKNVDASVQQASKKDLPPHEKDTEMFAKKPSPEKFPSGLAREPLDLAQRYDVYCSEQDGRQTIYRNVQFKSVKSVSPPDDSDQKWDFVELAEANGQTVFVAKATILRFCPAGAQPDVENL